MSYLNTVDESAAARTERHAEVRLDAAALDLYAVFFLVFWLTWTTFMLYSNLAAGQTCVLRLLPRHPHLRSPSRRRGQVLLDSPVV